MFKIFLVLTTIFILLVNLNHVIANEQEEPSVGFSAPELLTKLRVGINNFRAINGLDSLEFETILNQAAEHHAGYMGTTGILDFVEKSSKMKNTGARVTNFGGGKKAEEILFTTNIFKGKDELSTKFVADLILSKWTPGKREKPIILNPNYVKIGLGASVDKTGKKVFVSVIISGFDIYNAGAKKRKELKVPFTKKVKRISLATDISKECKNCDKIKDWKLLANGLYVEKGQIHLMYEDIKSLRKLLKNDNDGFAVDIVQRSQYLPADYNLMNNDLLSKGILLKRMYRDKLFSKNRAPLDNAGKELMLNVVLGKFPKKLKGDYEMNLLVIQSDKVCKILMKSEVMEGTQESNTPLEMLLMPDSDAYLKPKFRPTSESSILNFVVPFEKNKFDYKNEDIKPFLDALQEPDYNVDGIYIYAYASIEGDSVANAALQKKRAESIIEVFKKLHKSDINTHIKTNDSWDLFRLEMEDGKFADLTEMRKKDAIKKINSNKKLQEELEPYLSKQRFAEVVMDIIYDVKGEKEVKYCVATINKAIKKDDIKMAYKIQYYIEEKIKEGKYPANTLEKIELGSDAKLSGLKNNMLVHRYLRNGKSLSRNDVYELKKISESDPSNPYPMFNHVFSVLRFGEGGDRNYINQVQANIDDLYKTKISKKLIDALNIEFQFKVMKAADTLDNGAKLIEECVNKIKAFYNFKEGSWQNALKLSFSFGRAGDYRMAAQIIESFVFEQNPDEQLVFTYLSFCAQYPEKMKTKGFSNAMKIAQTLNNDRYCALFGAPHLTFQVLDNPNVKKDFIEAGCK